MDIGVNGRVFTVDQPSGAGQAGISLIQSLADHNHVEIYGHQNLEKVFNNSEIKSKYFTLDHQLHGVFWEQLILPHIIDNESKDVYFCPTMNAPVRDINTPVVLQIHDIFRYIGDVHWIDRVRQRLRLPPMIRNSDKVVTVSEFSKSEIESHFDIQEDKIEVIYNGVDPIFFEPQRSERYKEVPEEYLLYVGGTNTRKNIDKLLETYMTLRTDYGLEKDLVMVGPDPKSFHSYPSINIDEEYINVTGFVTQEELKKIYDHADVFLFPSRYEGFGMAPLEAMACRTPVVASNKASLPEILSDGAVLVDPSNVDDMAKSVNRIITDEDWRSEIIMKGKNRAREFTWDQSARDLQKVFESLVDQ